MKIILSIFFALGISILTNAQPSFTWAKQLGGTSADAGYAIATDPSGNVYTTGHFQGTVDLDPGAGVFTLTSNGGNDIFISKVNASGNFVWGKSIGGAGTDEGNSIAIDVNGNVCVAGSFSLTADFDPGAGTFSMTSAGTEDIYILKLDAAGNFVWAKQMGGTGTDIAYGIATDAAGNLFTTGYFNNTVDFDPGPGTFFETSLGFAEIFVSKLNASGNFVFEKTLTGPSTNIANAIALDALGNIYTTGYFLSSLDFDPGPGVYTLTSNGGPGDIFISKLDASGNFVWAKSIGGSAFDVGYSITVDPSGNVLTTGYFQSATDFDPGPGISSLTSNGVTDIFISKLDASGNFVWAKQIGGTSNDLGFAITTDGAGSVYTTGYFTSTVDFDPGVGTYTLTGTAGDIFISKLSAAGNFVWAAKTGSASIDEGHSITVDNMGIIYTTGFFDTNVDFDPGGGTYFLNSFGSSDDIFVLKLGQCVTPPQPGAISGPTSVCVGVANFYSVSPVFAATSYVWAFPGGWSGSSTTNTITATPGSSGIVSVTAANCGVSPQRTMNVTVHSIPTISVNGGTLCVGQSFVMFPSGAVTYTAQGGSLVVSPTVSTNYTVIGTSSAGCVSTIPATCNLNVFPSPTISAASSTNQLCAGDNATLTASGGNASYTWNPGGIGTSIIISPTVNTSYTVTGANGFGCESSTVITQAVINCPTSVSELQYGNSEIAIYPNPNNGILNVESAMRNENMRLQIFNVVGEIVMDEPVSIQHLKLNIQHFPNGIYFVKAGSYTTKIIKE
jgi:hypothetical protein